jgi:hypothetical protein
VVGIVYWKQDEIVQELIAHLNEDFVGEIVIEDSHVAPFENFPYISIDLEHVQIFEDKDNHKEPILDIKDAYLGFDLLTMISGDYDIKVIELKEGYIHAVQHENGELNITKALSSQKEVEDLEEELHIHLKSIELIDVDIYKLNEANGLMIESFIEHGELGFKTNDEHVLAHIDVNLEMNVIYQEDTTFFKHKHLNIDGEVEFMKESEMLYVSETTLELEDAVFKLSGEVDGADDYNLDLKLHGEKENFDLFLAFAPEALGPTLERYENEGKISLDCDINGKSLNGHFPNIEARFGCHGGHFTNNISHKSVDALNFDAYFTNNGSLHLKDMEFSLTDFTAKPEAGTFESNLHVSNFLSPEIEMTLDSDFDLNFLAQFINSTAFEDMHGNIQLHMKFHDIIDLAHPERSVTKLNEAYYTELLVNDLGFKSSAYHLALDDLNMKMSVVGHEAAIDYFHLNVGNTDLHMSGHITDLPAIIHHTDDEIIADFHVKSDLIDVEQLTSNDLKNSKPIDEKIVNLKMDFKFVTSARRITESPNLPVGEFFIENMYAKLEHYPHTFHDFHADVFIEDSNLRIIDFTGMIDESDFHFYGKLLEYERWMQAHPKGDTKIDFDLRSNHLHLEDLFSYKGENYVPEDYRHEELKELKLHGTVDLHFNDGLKSSDFYLTEVDAKMKMHPLKFEDFNGRVHLEDEHVVVEKLDGKIGKSRFHMDMNYYFGEDEKVRKRDNHFGLNADYLDFDALFSYEGSKSDLADSPDEHEEIFNIYDIPFSTMTIDLDINHLRYHRYILDDLHGRFRTTPEHYIYVDTLRMRAAGGKMMMSGYFNGSNRDKIYFSPKMKLKDVNLDELLFKFENFGQDHLVSENLHGKITTTINGKIHMHPDLVPILDDSEIHMDVEVVNGRLVNFEAIVDMKEYFIDKNVYNVKFDTLKNHIDFVNGNIEIPNMTINSSLGFLKISGKQDIDGNYEYYIQAPLKLIAGTAFKKLFGKPQEEVDPEQEDEIEYLDPEKKTSFVNVKIIGDSEDYKVSLGKDKSKKKRNKD